MARRQWCGPSNVGILDVLVSDGLEHEAVHVQEEGRVEVRVVLGEGLGSWTIS